MLLLLLLLADNIVVVFRYVGFAIFTGRRTADTVTSSRRIRRRRRMMVVMMMRRWRSSPSFSYRHVQVTFEPSGRRRLCRRRRRLLLLRRRWATTVSDAIFRSRLVVRSVIMNLVRRHGQLHFYRFAAVMRHAYGRAQGIVNCRHQTSNILQNKQKYTQFLKT